MKLDLKNPRLEPWLAAGLLTLVTALAYGVLLPRLGFYHDDWYMLWAGQAQGLSGIISLFQTDRPLIGWTYAVLFKFIGTNVLSWQVLALVLKIGTGLAVLWLLRLVWPERRLETTFATLLFVLYPGYYQQPVAATFVIDLSGLVAAFVSIGLTVYVVQSAKWPARIIATLVAMALALYYVILYEATIGLEVVRWALVWYLLQRGNPAPLKEKALHALQYLSPYILSIAIFVYWRLFIFKSVRRATNVDVILADYLRDPLYGLSQLLIEYFKDLFETIVSAWIVPFYQFTASGRYTNFVPALGISVVVLALVAAYFFIVRKQSPEPEPGDPLYKHLLWIGRLCVTLPSAVIVIFGRNVLFSTQFDRYTTQSMFGVALVVLGFVLYYLRGNARWAVLFSLLFLAVMTHYHSAAYHARYWDFQRNVVWQLSWRAPALQQDTLVVVSLPEGYRLAEEYEVWGPLNLAYAPGQPMRVSGQIPFDGMLLYLQAGTKEHRLNRNINVKRDYTRPLLVSMPSQNSCVHVLDGQHPALPFFEDRVIKEIVRYSRIDLIDPTAAAFTPSTATFGAEPAHGWCYYYQKIDLALQAGDFPLAAQLADEAAQLGLRPSDETEFVPLVIAYANVGNAEKAGSTAQAIDRDLRKYLCLQQSPEAPWPPGYNSQLIRTSLCGEK